MQDSYVGDIGDYGKYSLLRAFCEEISPIAVNWYKVEASTDTMQNDGKFISYLDSPSKYRSFDPPLFDSLSKIVKEDKDRTLARIEAENLFPGIFFSEPLSSPRELWHQRALQATKNTDVIFLDPDNGLETERMYETDSATFKHVKWNELKDYYQRGQSVILYQHRPQMCTKEDCIESMIDFQRKYLRADSMFLMEYPQYTNRFYFIFSHYQRSVYFKCKCVVIEGRMPGFCREIGLVTYHIESL